MRRIILALAVLASLGLNAEAQAPRWCDSLPAPSLGRIYACGQGQTAAEAERNAIAGISRQLRAAVSDSVRWARHVVTQAAIGDRETTTVGDTASTLTTVVSDLAVKNVRIERGAKAGRTYYALALLDVSRELAEFNDLTAQVEDSLTEGRIAGALTVCRYALARIGDNAWAPADNPLCNELPGQLFDGMRIDLLDSSRALVRFGRVRVSGVRLLLRRRRGEEPTVSAPTSDRGIVALAPPRGYAGGGSVIEEIDIDWIGLGEYEAPFRARATRTSTTIGVSVAVSVKGALSDRDRLAMSAALAQAIRDLGWSVAEGASRPTWALAVEADVRDMAVSLGQVPTAAVTLRWEAVAADSTVPVGRGGAVDVRGAGTDRAAARTEAFRKAAAQVAADLELLASSREKP